MGMFDSVIFFCPYCNEEITEQSKVGICELKEYHQASVPANIALDLKDTTISCPKCDIPFLIAGEVPRISLRLTDKKQENGYD